MAKKLEKKDDAATGELIVELLKDKVFEVEGCPKSTIKRPDGQFRTMTLMAGWEFFLIGSRIGKGNQLIFQFSPVDTQEFEIAEIEMRKVDGIFPLLGGALSEAIKENEDYGEAFAKEQYGVVENFLEIFGSLERAVRDSKINQKQKATENYASNPKFGLF